jgi:hypothetical protein
VNEPPRRDLEDRTFKFAETVRQFVKTLPKTIGNTEDVRQLVRASGSVAANWIEADEALSMTSRFLDFSRLKRSLGFGFWNLGFSATLGAWDLGFYESN